MTNERAPFVQDVRLAGAYNARCAGMRSGGENDVVA